MPPPELHSQARRKVYDGLRAWGASFFEELLAETGLLKTPLEEALGELTAWGLITCDSFRGLRELILPQRLQRRRHAPSERLAAAGRWSLLRPAAAGEADALDHRTHHANAAATVWSSAAWSGKEGCPPGGNCSRLSRLEAPASCGRALRTGFRASSTRCGRSPLCGKSATKTAGRPHRDQCRRSAQSHRHRHAGAARRTAAGPPPAVRDAPHAVSAQRSACSIR
jgi:hypothetical protein